MNDPELSDLMAYAMSLNPVCPYHPRPEKRKEIFSQPSLLLIPKEKKRGS
ncbi:unnamed protein product [Periconia digitata]|uniref:Uncharacterized protein n=1 Tax=Periconia digitata TaxID=1303443 RepID=A0A9W4XQH2_9PLEO|nr:unnamed protein product [Periconia digitata]